MAAPAFPDQKDGMDEDYHPYAYLDKSSVLQEARVFHDSNHVRMHPKRCCMMLTKLLFLLAQGEKFVGSEASEVFFGVTKLFQSEDGNLRRMVYLFLKEVVESTDAAEIIIVVQSLCKDMNSDVDLYRANAIRVLSRIVDNSMLGQIERYIKQSIVDRHELVASSALVSGLRMIRHSPDIIRRWVSEVQTALGADAEMVQFHALALLHNIRAADPRAISRIATQLMRNPAQMRSPLGTCMVVRYVASLLGSDLSILDPKAAYAFLDSCLRHRSEMVIYEAARTMCELPDVEARDLAPAMTVFSSFLTSPKAVVRFSAVKTLSKVAQRHPTVVARANEDLENLIGDSNRTIATLAITTLLKTGSEGSIDRFMRQIGKFMGDIGDEFKIVVVKAIHDLVMRVPRKHASLFAFLANALREEGGYEFKRTIVDVLTDCMEKVPGSSTDALYQLCEFIEDCEFTVLATRVLHLLGDKGPSDPNPAGFIRFIYNRLLLENAAIRAAAVSALAKFASKVPALRTSIVTLLQRCSADEDDEVRDRATLYLRLLEEYDAAEASSGPTSASESEEAVAAAAAARSITSGQLPMSVKALTKSLHMYQLRPVDGPLTFDVLPRAEEEALAVHTFATERKAIEEKSRKRKTPAAAAAASSTPAGAASGGGASTDSANEAAEALYKIPEFKDLGPLFRSAKAVPLTENELEYLVSVTKHVFEEHIVFDFTITNTLEEVQLENASIIMTPTDEEQGAAWVPTHVIAASVVTSTKPAHAYVCLRRNIEEGAGYPAGTWNAEMRFRSVDVDPDTGEKADPDDEGVEEDYPLEDVEFGVGDYIAPLAVQDFRHAWEAQGDEGQHMEAFTLPFPDVHAAVPVILKALGLRAVDGSEEVKPGAKKHNCFLAGTFVGGHQVLARMQVLGRGTECVLRLAVRTEDIDLSQLVLSAIE